MAAVYCTQCGAMNSSEDSFCSQCGAPLETIVQTQPLEQPAQANALDAQYQQLYNPAPQQQFQTAPQPQTYAAPVAYPQYGQQPQPQPKSHTGLIVGIIAVVAAVAVAVILIVFGGFGSTGTSSNAASSAAPGASTTASQGASTTSNSGNATANSGQSSAASSSAAASTASSASATSANSEYVLPESNTRYYSKAELEKLSNLELYRARNEIYARYGRGFKNDDLRQWFGSKSWYKEKYSPSEFDSMPSPLNDYERKNADLMLEIEQSRNSPYV